jgi:diamine N-acetyltransferase
MIALKEAGIEMIPLIQELAEITWADAYAAILSPRQMRYMLDLFYSVSSLTNQIEVEGHCFILAMEEEIPSGFSSFSPKALMAADGQPARLSPDTYRLHKLYVHPLHQGKGIGKIMLDHIVSSITQNGAKQLELNVNRNNKAIRFYERYGFIISRHEDIHIGHGYFMNDHVMTLAV